MTFLRCVVLGSALLQVTCANAAVVFSSLGPGLGYDPTSGISIDGPASAFPQGLAEPFSLSATSTLDRVEVAVSTAIGLPALNVRLFADLSGVPGELLEESSVSGFSNGLVTADFSGQLVLAAGTDYWLGLFASGANQQIWHDTTSGQFAMQAASTDDGATWTISSSNPFPRAAFRVHGTAIVAPDIPLIAEAAAWRFFRGLQEPSAGTQWTTSTFTDATWSFGAEGFGYDTDPITQPGLMAHVDTPLPDMRDNGNNPNAFTTLYLRRNFAVADPAALAQLVLQLDYDDSFIAYINGTEVARSSFGTAGMAEPFDALGSDHESTNGDPAKPLPRFAIDLINDFPGLLLAGTANVLAIQGLNVALDDSDFVLSRISLGANPIAMPLAGDYNNNGTVDAADYVVWRDNLGTSTLLPNDPIGGTIGQVHHDQWRSHFSQPAGAAVFLEVAIPEPRNSALVVLTAVAGIWIWRRTSTVALR